MKRAQAVRERGSLAERTTAAALACCTLVALAGCGSSDGSRTSSAQVISVRTSGPSASVKVGKGPKYASVPASAPLQSGVVQVAYRNYTIAPDTLKVKRGSTIRWTNYDPALHNVTSTSGPQHFASENFGHGASVEVKLERPGVIHYESTTTPATMNGTIEVVK